MTRRNSQIMLCVGEIAHFSLKHKKANNTDSLQPSGCNANTCYVKLLFHFKCHSTWRTGITEHTALA